MPVNLTRNAIAAILDGDINFKPLVQVLDIKLINSKSNQERYRLLLSDGSSSHQAMIAIQLNHLVKSADVRPGSVIQLIDYICSDVQNRKYVSIYNFLFLWSFSEFSRHYTTFVIGINHYMCKNWSNSFS